MAQQLIDPRPSNINIPRKMQADAFDPRRENIIQLCYNAFDDASNDVLLSQTSLKTLANTLLIHKKARQILVDIGYVSQVANRLGIQDPSRDNEMLCSRILFLLTYDTNFDFGDLLSKHDLAQHIHEASPEFIHAVTKQLTGQNISFHADIYSNQGVNMQAVEDSAPPSVAQPSIDARALTESLKLFFNLSQHYPQSVPKFSETIRPILSILDHINLPTPVFQPPITSLVNALVNLNVSDTDTALFPDSEPCHHLARLILILDSGLRSEKNIDRLETVAPPFILVLRRVNEVAPAEVKSLLRSKLLPSDEERTHPLGKSDSLASYLLRLSNSPSAPQLKDTISTLLFELSDKDPMTFIQNVGYGYASGYLMSHQISIPKILDGRTGAQAKTVNGQDINPITGQRLDMEPTDDGPEMTDEEKEREAERLFILFERLKATGVVDVVNPVRQAQESGRLEEVD